MDAYMEYDSWKKVKEEVKEFEIIDMGQDEMEKDLIDAVLDSIVPT